MIVSTMQLNYKWNTNNVHYGIGVHKILEMNFLLPSRITALLFLNNESPIHTSFRFNTSEILGITVTTNPHIYSLYNWNLQRNFTRIHLPILIKILDHQCISKTCRNICNIIKLNRENFTSITKTWLFPLILLILWTRTRSLLKILLF